MKIVNSGLGQSEERRVAALRELELLDTAPEERFDRFTRIAMKLFDVPIALVSLVDVDRQFFKSRQGLDSSQTARAISFCTHSIQQETSFVVPDALLDPRFASNPLVVGEPKIRFYAGHPLRAGDGSPIGTLCLIDRKPRELRQDELKLLADLAAMVEAEFTALRMATTDALTGISNRRGFMLIAGEALAIADRLNAPSTVLFFDLDDFKKINDQFGHPEGDRALTAFADALVKTFRNADVVGRIGGDEFCVFAIGPDEAMTVPLERLAETLAKLPYPYAIRHSVGRIRVDPCKHKSVEALLGEADALMYSAKRGRGEGR